MSESPTDPPSPGEKQPEAQTSASPVYPRQWLVLQVAAALEAVATSNYACYGRGGVPRYPVSSSHTVPPTDQQDPATLCAELMMQDAQGTTQLANLDLTLRPSEQTSQRTVWNGYNLIQHLQTLWVWDFFRIQSHVVLRVAIPSVESETSSVPEAWQAALDAIQAMQPGGMLQLTVRSACGDIHQEHPITQPAIKWEPDARAAANNSLPTESR